MEAGVSLLEDHMHGIDGIVRRLIMSRAATSKPNSHGFKPRLQLDTSGQGPKAMAGDRTKTHKIPLSPNPQKGVNPTPQRLMALQTSIESGTSDYRKPLEAN
jgi:hypothetical protein